MLSAGLEWDPIWRTPAQKSHALRLRYQCCLRISDISAYGPITGLSPRHKKLARRGLTSQATFWSESQMDHVINSTSNSGPDHQSWLHYNMVHIPWITLCTLSPKLWLKHSKWEIKDSTCLVINRACLGVAINLVRCRRTSRLKWTPAVGLLWRTGLIRWHYFEVL